MLDYRSRPLIKNVCYLPRWFARNVQELAAMIKWTRYFYQRDHLSECWLLKAWQALECPRTVPWRWKQWLIEKYRSGYLFSRPYSHARSATMYQSLGQNMHYICFALVCHDYMAALTELVWSFTGILQVCWAGVGSIVRLYWNQTSYLKQYMYEYAISWPQQNTINTRTTYTFIGLYIWWQHSL